MVVGAIETVLLVLSSWNVVCMWTTESGEMFQILGTGKLPCTTEPILVSFQTAYVRIFNEVSCLMAKHSRNQ